MLKSSKKSDTALPVHPTPTLPVYDNNDQPPRYDQALTTGALLDSTTLHPTEKHVAETQSIASTATSNVVIASTLLPDIPFVEGRTLILQARGIRAMRVPTPSNELEIHVLNQDGTPLYTSKRPRQCKGDCVLMSHTGRDLVATEYFFGPKRAPVVRSLSGNSQDQPILRICPNGRKLAFLHLPSGAQFVWSYSSAKTAQGDRAKVLSLRAIPANAAKHDTGEVIAQLIRCNSTRTPGTKRSFAGNGGQLVLSQEASTRLSEDLIVASCIMMLKREIDRRRFKQFAFMMAGVWLIS